MKKKKYLIDIPDINFLKERNLIETEIIEVKNYLKLNDIQTTYCTKKTVKDFYNDTEKTKYTYTEKIDINYTELMKPKKEKFKISKKKYKKLASKNIHTLTRNFYTISVKGILFTLVLFPYSDTKCLLEFTVDDTLGDADIQVPFFVKKSKDVTKNRAYKTKNIMFSKELRP